MTRRLIFLLGRTEADLVRWAIADGGEVLDFGAAEGAPGLAAIAPYASDVGEVVALLPGEQVACRRMPTAPKSGAKLKAAAAYLMEDELAEATEFLQVAAASTPALSVALAARATIVRGWLAAFETAGIDIDVLTADYLALSSSVEEATLVEDGARVIAAFAGVGFAIEKDLFRSLAVGLFATPPAAFRVLGDDAICAALTEGSEIERLGPSGDAAVLRAIAKALDAAASPNFLQKRLFRQKQLAGALGPWRRAAALAAGLVAVGFLSTIVEGVQLSRAEARWTESAKELHAQRFPDAADEEPVAYARKRLASGGDEAPFLLITSRVAVAVEANDAIDIDRLRFDSARGDYTVSIRSKSDAAVEAFKADLARAGVAAADSGGFRKTGEFWSGDLKARLQ